MLDPKEFFNFLKSIKINFFTGVPDSLLKSFCGYVSDHSDKNNHIIAANEGGAIGIGIGYHLATGRIPMIYMQNSGIGNAINPLLSLADPEVYSIPMIVLVGWRGEPGVKDEPQHIKQGRVMLPLIDSLQLPYWILTGNIEDDKALVNLALAKAVKDQTPVFLIARKDLFESYEYIHLKNIATKNISHTREDIIKEVLSALPQETLVVATTGMASREIYEHRKNTAQSHASDFLTVGGMGHASQIAFGISINTTQKNIVCLDGDGAAIMHLGSMAIGGQTASNNYKHILLNNGSHDSVGGQPTVGFDINFRDLAISLGYKVIDHPQDQEISYSIKQLLQEKGPAFLELKTLPGSRSDLGRPTSTPKENKKLFMQNSMQPN
jgi:phosphonopyruvate decarboxylase